MKSLLSEIGCVGVYSNGDREFRWRIIHIPTQLDFPVAFDTATQATMSAHYIEKLTDWNDYCAAVLEGANINEDKLRHALVQIAADHGGHILDGQCLDWQRISLLHRTKDMVDASVD